jgi:hypothetical protein
MLWRSLGFDLATASNCGEGGAGSRRELPEGRIDSDEVPQLENNKAVTAAAIREEIGNLMRTEV